MIRLAIVYRILLGLALTAGFSSCAKVDPEITVKDLENLSVSESFSWSTANEISFKISSEYSTIVRIESVDQTVLYHKGFYNGLSDQYMVTIGLSGEVSFVLVNGQKVAITGRNIDYSLPPLPLLKAGQSLPALVSHWAFEENQGDRVKDSQGANDGIATGATWVPGVLGSSLRFDGVRGNVSIPDSKSMQLDQSVTLMAWVKAERYASAKIAQKGDWDGFGIYLDVWKGWKAAIFLDNQTSHDVGTTEGRPILDQWYHLAMTYDGSYLKLYVNGAEKGSSFVPGRLNKNGRNFSIGSDNAVQKFFQGSVDEVYLYGGALTPVQVSAHYLNGPNSDQDGDGIADADDSFPTDRERAFLISYPASGTGSLAFEDLWPGKGDYDFNDLVLDYQFHTTTNSKNFVKEIQVDITIRAIGASMPGGFGFQFGNDGLRGSDIKVTGYDVVSPLFKMEQNGIESNQEKPTIIVFDKAGRLLKWKGGSGVNTETGSPYSDPVRVTVMVEISGEYTQDEIGIINFNPFMIVNEDRGREIHLPDHRPTSLASGDYYGTRQDRSDPGTGRYYKTSRNLPWALNLIESFDYPIEKTSISAAHLVFYDWAASDGKKYADWYLNKAGYRDDNLIYRK
jgi:LruC domain-containing protein